MHNAVLTAGIVLAVAGTAAFAAGPPTVDVNVTNTPLPVQGIVSISNLPVPITTTLVTLQSGLPQIGACPPLNGPAGIFDTILASDGTRSAFSIPAGKVLVITAVDLLGFGVAGNAGIQTRLWRGQHSIEIFSIRESLATSAGRIFHRYVFPSGVEVANSGKVCTNANDNDLVTSGFLYGYLK